MLGCLWHWVWFCTSWPLGGAAQKADWLALALIYAALWEISPVFGQTNLWMCGACNYLWATVGCCAFLLPWRYYLQQPFASTARMAAGMALAGLLAGWLSENTSAGMLVCLVLAGAVVFKRERRLPAWMATGLAGGAGWVCFAHHRARQL